MGSASLQRPWPTNLRARSAEVEGSTGAGLPAVWAVRVPPATATDNSSAACRPSDPAWTHFPFILSSCPPRPWYPNPQLQGETSTPTQAPKAVSGQCTTRRRFVRMDLPDAPNDVSGVWRDEPTKVRILTAKRAR